MIRTISKGIYMDAQQIATAPAGRKFLTTAQFAAELGLQPETLLKRHSATGSYHGVRPVKLPNRFLAWPADAVEQLLSAGE